MNFQEYPKVKYHATKPERVVLDALQEHELGEEWCDSKPEALAYKPIKQESWTVRAAFSEPVVEVAVEAQPKKKGRPKK